MSIYPLNILLSNHKSTDKLAGEKPKISQIIRNKRKGLPLTRNEENYLWMVVPYLPVAAVIIGIILMLVLQSIYK